VAAEPGLKFIGVYTQRTVFAESASAQLASLDLVVDGGACNTNTVATSAGLKTVFSSHLLTWLLIVHGEVTVKDERPACSEALLPYP
jgi:hypothetical protein